MTLRRALLICGFLCSCAAGVGALLVAKSAQPSGQIPEVSDHSKPFDPSQWAWRNEEHWAVDQTARDITEMLLFAKGEHPEAYRFSSTPDPKVPHDYLLRLEGPALPTPLEGHVTLHQWLWDPKDFGDWTQALIKRLGLRPGGGNLALSREIPQRLLNPIPEVVLQASNQVSAVLTQAPTSADAHDAAGAVLATFGLFDTSRVYQDHRHLLCRMSAHAALADAFRKEKAGPSAQVARLGLLLMVGRTASCLEELGALKPGQSDSLPEAWKNTLSMLTTGDWRKAPEKGVATPAENMASFAGRCQFQSVAEALEWFQSRCGPDLPAYVCHAGLSWDTRVGSAEYFNEAALAKDLQDWSRTYKTLFPGVQLTKASWLAAANAHPERAYAASSHDLEVLGWGAWAQRYQADMLDAIMSQINYLDARLGSKPDLNAYLDSIEKTYSGLEGFPILQKRYANLRPAVYPRAIAQAETLVRTHPECVSDANFVCLAAATPGGSPPASMPRYSQWLTLPVPFGTTYNIEARCWETREWKEMPLTALQDLRKVNPTFMWLARVCMDRQFGPSKPTPAAVEAVYGPIRGFAPELYLDWMAWATPKDTPEQVAILRELTSYNSSAYFRLGKTLVRMHQDTQALKAFLDGYEKDENRVGVSNAMLWTVQYLYKSGNTARAESIAEDCGEVYSAEGLHTLAVLREMQGRYPEADAIYDQMKERYGDDADRLGLYARTADKNPRMKEKLTAMTASLFPHGLQTFVMPSPLTAPTRGVLFSAYPDWAQKDGLPDGAIVVALDGYRVENQQQYLAVRSIGLGDDFTLTVYAGGKYKTVPLNAPGRLLGVDLKDFVAP